MKAILWFCVGLIAGASAIAGRVGAEATFQPFQLVDRQAFLEKLPAAAQADYLKGMSDAFTFLRPENAIGAGLTKCFREWGVKHVFYLYAPVFTNLKEAKPSEPIASVFLRTVRPICGESIK